MLKLIDSLAGCKIKVILYTSLIVLILTEVLAAEVGSAPW